MRTLLACLVSVLIAPAAPPGDAPKPPAPRQIEEADTVFALYKVDNTLGGGVGRRLVIVVWGDGYIVWSGDRIEGGPPYRAGRADPKKVAKYFAQVESDGTFDDKTFPNQSIVIPDQDYVTLTVKKGKKKRELNSVHELREEDSKWFAAPSGVHSLDGQSRYSALKDLPKKHLFFRLVWSELRDGAARLIPSESQLVRGKLVVTENGSEWVESAEQPLKPATKK